MRNEISSYPVSERYKEYRQKLQQMRLIDDTFMTEVFADKDCAELLLRVILDRDDIFVKEVITQETIQNFVGHSVRLDIRIEDAVGKLYNVEIQRSKEGAVPQRARYNSGALNAISLPKSADYREMLETYVIFITELDIFKAGLPIYHVERMVLEIGEMFNDGEHIIYVNSGIQDSSPLGRLMHDFYCTNVDDMMNTTLRNRALYFKSSEEGVKHMCEIMEQIADENYKRGEAKSAKILLNLIKEGILTKEQALEQFGGTYEELEKSASYISER